jgi:hypothetical protein
MPTRIVLVYPWHIVALDPAALDPAATWPLTNHRKSETIEPRLTARGNALARITVEEAKALADRWKAQREDQDREPHAGHYRNASPHDLIKMWNTEKGADGKRLTQREFGCLVEAWVEVFGGLPPSKDDGASDRVAATATESIVLPADDTMLRSAELIRLTGISKSTMRVKGWLARDVKSFIDMLIEQRKCPRQ